MSTTAKLGWLVAGVAVVVVLVMLVTAHIRADGANDAEVKRLNAAVAVALKAGADSAALFRQAVAGRDSVESRYRAAEAGRRAATAATDAARTLLGVVRDSAAALVRDTAATVPQLRASLSALILASDSSQRAWQRERDSTTRARRGADSTIAADKRAIAAGLAAVGAHERTIAVMDSTLKAERRQRPGLVARATRGVVSAVSGAACGGGAYVLAGPFAAVGAFVVCAAVAGVVR